MNNLSATVKRLRKQYNLTQEELSLNQMNVAEAAMESAKQIELIQG